jgi:hypothetical protein
MTPGEIARELSKAQREALIAARETVLMDRMKLPGKNKALRQLGLAVLAWRGGDLLTPLGLAVRAILEQESRDE